MQYQQDGMTFVPTEKGENHDERRSKGNTNAYYCADGERKGGDDK